MRSAATCSKAGFIVTGALNHPLWSEVIWRRRRRRGDASTANGKVITGPIIAEIAAPIADPARATMLLALIDGRALTASEFHRPDIPASGRAECGPKR
jgi:hypothetical protein